MATTMTMPLATAASTTTASSTLPENELHCPNCGLSLPSPASDPHIALLQARRQIEDLQAQVRLLNQKATAAADRWADYEDELSRLRAASTSTNSTNTTTSTKNNNNNNNNSSSNGNVNNNHNNNNNRPHTPDPSVTTNSPRSSFLGAGASRISQLLSPRKSPSASSTPPPTTTATNTSNTTTGQPQRGSLSSVPESPALVPDEARKLLKALTHERRLRAAAEEKLEATNREVEDLSASLFEQANNMVAEERRARAALEEQLDALRWREEEKKDRIGRLEGAVMRIERVRVMLEDKEMEVESEGGEGSQYKDENEDEDEDSSEEEMEGEGGLKDMETRREAREDTEKTQRRLTREEEENIEDEREDEEGKNRTSLNGHNNKYTEQVVGKAARAEG
ncbi:hypothetical protein F5Y08DRAFT_164688 [Xylaria arbuscula]|nr:hypothetical protein F5Y08DRAFT_164688 [Xylaria arbuscula]